MKKIVLSLAGVMAAVAFAPEASAVPAFARQTGMACSACHFQHFPLLNGFGRAFKSSAFTMMGAQGKIEGEHLSIPSQLNMAILATAFKQQESGNAAKKWGVPASGGELSLFVGGKVSDFAGFLSEVALTGGVTGVAGAVGAGVAAAKMPILFEVAEGTRAGLVGFTTGGQGAGYSFETLNTGAAGGVHRLMGNAGPSRQHGTAAAAAMYLGGGRTNATGLAGVVNNDRGFLNIAKFELAGPGATASQLPATYVRAAGFFDVSGWDMGAGIQNWSGYTGQNGLKVADVKGTVIDFQAQGEAAGMPMGIYASYGTSGASTIGNVLNGGVVNYDSSAFVATPTTSAASSFNVAADVGVIPGVMTAQVAFRQGKLGNNVLNGVTGANNKDNAFMVGVTYELAQNMELSAHYTTQSGSAWAPVAGKIGKNAYTLLLETMF